MDSLLFIAIIVCLGLVVVWYVVNESARAKGEKGFLAIAPDKREIEAPSYREKKRVARPGQTSDPAEAPSFTERQGGFREKADGGYKSTGPTPRFTGRPTNRPQEPETKD
jgi:hypothetical protein